jgi:hypothetical protein
MEGRMAIGFVSEPIGAGTFEKFKYILRGKEVTKKIF